MNKRDHHYKLPMEQMLVEDLETTPNSKETGWIHINCVFMCPIQL